MVKEVKVNEKIFLQQEEKPLKANRRFNNYEQHALIKDMKTIIF